MSSNTNRDRTSEVSLCQVTASVDGASLEKLKKAIDGVSFYSIMIGSVVSWTDPGHQLRYRGKSHTEFRRLKRVEIICSAEQVDSIVNTLEMALRTDPLEAIPVGKIIVLQIGGPSDPALIASNDSRSFAIHE